jgi:flagellar export protein FliJ
MKRFHFRLEKLLDRRRRIQEQQQWLLEHKSGELNAAQRDLIDFVSVMKQHDQEVRRERMVGQVDANYLIAYRRFVTASQYETAAKLEDIRRLQREVDRQREHLVIAFKEAKAIERLREKKYAEYKRHVRKSELIEANEIGLEMHRRRELSLEPASC